MSDQTLEVGTTLPFTLLYISRVPIGRGSLGLVVERVNGRTPGSSRIPTLDCALFLMSNKPFKPTKRIRVWGQTPYWKFRTPLTHLLSPFVTRIPNTRDEVGRRLDRDSVLTGPLSSINLWIVPDGRRWELNRGSNNTVLMSSEVGIGGTGVH